jgi:cyclopropane-fatty-acyl-phospholipid synthase
MSPSFSEAARSLLPRNYSQIRPHHAAALYAAVRYIASTSFYRKLADKILSYMSSTTERLIPLVYAGIVPDFLIRFGIRIQLYDHLAILRTTDCEVDLAHKMAIVEELTNMPIAIETDLANAQHYEVPAAFYDLCLGPVKKYSSGLWPTRSTTFEESELHMLDLYCERAQLQDGMSIVDLGCGWGSLSLHLAERYPNAKITSISNSRSQREYILETAKSRGYNVNNINVITVSRNECDLLLEHFLPI